MKMRMRWLISCLLAAFLLFPGAALGEEFNDNLTLPGFTLVDYPANTDTSQVAVNFAGASGYHYVLEHQYKGVWLAPLHLTLTGSMGAFTPACLPGENKFVLRNFGHTKKAKTSIAFTVTYAAGADAPDTVNLPIPTLRKGSKGVAVSLLQTALQGLDLYTGTIDGIFDTETRKAVIAAQKQLGIKADGVAGPITLGKLNLTSYAVPISALTQQSGDTGTSGGTDSSADTEEVRTLKQGMEGADVKKLQKRLTALGYDPGKADGIFGPKTLAAVLLFQKNAGITQDGIVGPATRKKLKNGAGSLVPETGYVHNHKKGSTGTHVTAIQNRLIALGYLTGTADGVFGKLTDAAVRAFQAAQGITVDGIVGPVTYGKLFP